MNDEMILRTLTGRASPSEEAAVVAWRKRSEDNNVRYRELMKLLQLATDAHGRRVPGPVPSVQEVVTRSRGSEGNQAGGAPGARRRVVAAVAVLRESRLAVACGTAAAVLLVSGVLSTAPDEAAPSLEVSEFVTGPAETATVVFNDGTVVRLGGQSRLRLPGGYTDRELAVTGRAYFAVARSEDRPFRVHTGAGQVEVFGTRFAVEASGEDLEVVVVEGRVAVLSSGQQVEVGPQQMAKVMKGNPLPVLSIPNAEEAAAWVGDFLAFQDTPLRQAVLEIERKHGISIEIVDPSLANRTITAWFADWTADEVMEAICIVASARCEVRDSAVTMHARTLTIPDATP